jgi:uncharacterized cupin superfamily protein
MIKSFNVRDTAHTSLVTREGETLSKSLVLTNLFNFKDLFVHHEILEPGKRASRAHAHSHREEMVFILSGKCEINQGGKTAVLEEGDFVGVLPNSEPYFISNNFKDEVKFLVICSNPLKDQVFY